MNTKEYFEKRAIETEQHSKERGEKYLIDLKKSYELTKYQLKKDIKNFYKKYANQLEKISNIDARKALTQKELKEYNELIQSRIEKSALSETDKKIFRQKYLISRLNKMESLLNQINVNIDILTKNYEDTAINHLSENYKQSYSQTAHTLYNAPNVVFAINFNAFDDRAIESIVKTKWSNKGFSQRIWGHRNNSAREIKNILNIGVSLGYSVDKMSKQIEQRLEVNYSNAKRLVRTESNYILSEATNSLYKDVELEQYRFLAVLDYKTSAICQSLDNKIFNVKDRKIGVNCNPMHPNCRSTTVPYIPEYEDLKNETRLARDVDGKTYKLPANFDYKAWYESMTDEKKAQHNTTKIKHKNRASDKRQYNRYKNVLGNNAPKSLEEFQKLKYNDGNKYNLIKTDYSRRNKLLKDKSLSLPNVNTATIDDRKFTHYLFGGDKEVGLNKGRLISKKLGYNISNFNELKKEILNKAKLYPSKHKGNSPYGKRYEQRIFIYDKDRNPVNLEIGWQVSEGKTHMTSIYITEVKK